MTVDKATGTIPPMTRRRSSSSHASRHSPTPSRPQGGGRLRIIGGEYRRRLLPVLDSPGLRPTPDRVRETLFNWLALDTPGARVLDLFAGSGALGLEALSRGAASAVFVERDLRVAQALGANLELLGAALRGRVQVGDALAFLASPPPASLFTLAFLDPPFRQGLAEPCCLALEQGWLAEEAYVYLETESELAVAVPATWQLHRDVRAGDSTGRLYHRRAAG